MNRDCIVNPVTNRAVLTSSPLGKKLLKEETKRMTGASSLLKAVAKRAITPKTKTPQEPTSKKPANLPSRGRKTTKTPQEPKSKKPANLPTRGKKTTGPFTMYAEPIGPKKPQEPKSKKPANLPTRGRKTTKTTEPFTMYKEPIGPKKPSTKAKPKVDADYIRRYADYLYNRFTKEKLAEQLEKAKNGDEVKDIYSDYMGPLYKAQRVINIMIDTKITKEEKDELLKIVKMRKLYFGTYSSEFFGTKQDYLFKFEEPAE